MSKPMFCPECGAPRDSDAMFCNNCGTKFAAPKAKEEPSTQYSAPQQPGRFSQLGNFQQPAPGFTPVAIMEPRYWQEGGLLDAVIGVYKSPAETVPKVMEDHRNAPNATVLVVIWAIINALVSYFSSMKADYRPGEGVTPQDVADLEADLAATALTSAFFVFAGVFLGWYIGSWILAALLRGGIPQNSVIKMDFGAPMRSLQAYRYVPSIIVGVIQLAVIIIEPAQVSNIEIFSVLGQEVPTPFPVYSSLMSTTLLLGGLFTTIASLYVLYKGINALGYRGGLLSILVFIMGAWQLYGLTAFL